MSFFSNGYTIHRKFRDAKYDYFQFSGNLIPV